MGSVKPLRKALLHRYEKFRENEEGIGSLWNILIIFCKVFIFKQKMSIQIKSA